MNCTYAADQLLTIYQRLRTYEGFQDEAAMCLAISANLRKMAPRVVVKSEATALKPPPPRIDPNSMIPRPVPPPRGSGPVRLKVGELASQ